MPILIVPQFIRFAPAKVRRIVHAAPAIGQS
jgi:hypothetical protein